LAALRYPEHVAAIIDILSEAAELQREVDRVNASAPPNEHRRLFGVELSARSLDSFSASTPSIARELKLPAWEPNTAPLWPPPQRVDASLFAPVPFNPRYSARWWEAAEEERQQQRERIERELADEERAKREFYGQAPAE
jgi:hypothetical protein